ATADAGEPGAPDRPAAAATTGEGWPGRARPDRLGRDAAQPGTADHHRGGGRARGRADLAAGRLAAGDRADRPVAAGAAGVRGAHHRTSLLMVMVGAGDDR